MIGMDILPVDATDTNSSQSLMRKRVREREREERCLKLHIFRSGSPGDRPADLEIKDAAYRSERVLEAAPREHVEYTMSQGARSTTCFTYKHLSFELFKFVCVTYLIKIFSLTASLLYISYMYFFSQIKIISWYLKFQLYPMFLLPLN